MKNSREILLSFINEMCTWEIDFENICKIDESRYLDENIQNLKREQLIKIQERYLSSSALKLQQERRVILNFRNPPEYQQVIIGEDITKTQAIYLTSRQEEEFAKFFMVLENGNWKLDKLAYCSTNWKVTRKLF